MFMPRWQPNARERLEKAAMDLYRERGYDETAVADIAARAGLTERTFFRHFTDKREVLFGGALALQEFLAGRIVANPASMSAIDSVAAALEATSSLFEDRRPFAKARQAIIAANAALRERELIKIASLASAIAGALRARAVPGSAATLAAETGIAIFKLAFEQWVNDVKKRDLAQHVREALAELKSVAAGGQRRSAPVKKRSPARGARGGRAGC
jgi:AcrR family transcriptional regulator